MVKFFTYQSPAQVFYFIFWIAELFIGVLGGLITSCSSGENLPPAEFSEDTTEEFRSLLELANEQVFNGEDEISNIIEFCKIKE